MTSKEGPPGPPPPARGPGLGWKIALVVWVTGFLGLFLFEVCTLLWRLARRLF